MTFKVPSNLSHSVIFPGMEVRLTSLQFPGSSFFPSLKMAAIVPFFLSPGSLPDSHDSSNMVEGGLATTSASPFGTLGWMLSCSIDLYTLRLTRQSQTCSSLTVGWGFCSLEPCLEWEDRNPGFGTDFCASFELSFRSVNVVCSICNMKKQSFFLGLGQQMRKVNQVPSAKKNCAEHLLHHEILMGRRAELFLIPVPPSTADPACDLIQFCKAPYSLGFGMQYVKWIIDNAGIPLLMIQLYIVSLLL